MQGVDPYHKPFTQGMWANDTHSLSFTPHSTEWLLRYGSSKIKGWSVSKRVLFSMAQEYKMDVAEWLSLHDFYYKYANRYMKEWRKHVQYKLTFPTDWTTLKLYQVFVIQKRL
jgi:hypothetical protein